MPEGEALNTVTFSETEGRTILTILIKHASKETRDAHIESGMEVGMQEGMDLLERVAISLRYSAQRDPADTRVVELQDPRSRRINSEPGITAERGPRRPRAGDVP